MFINYGHNNLACKIKTTCKVFNLGQQQNKRDTVLPRDYKNFPQ